MRNTMNLGESINTYDPAEALQGELGTLSRQGPHMRLRAGPHAQLQRRDPARLEVPPPKQQQEPYLITKIQPSPRTPRRCRSRRSPERGDLIFC